ncbi:unnamed protein product [Parnassius apollo]|uniref:(apollo) hypothetical protein n=1 Tax=Parnassius apollo TaxID=110799 RepID=A0A8S3XQY0_PARAO|nr:unnamed protein product [Parnassius apollo]
MSEYDPKCDKDEDTENETNGSVKSYENLKTKVTILSDIKNTADNQAYFDLSKYGPFELKPINTLCKVKTKADRVGRIKKESSKMMTLNQECQN